jgi:hypothetical protein
MSRRHRRARPTWTCFPRAVLEVLKDGHREAVIKCLFIWSAVQAGTFTTDAQTIALLKNYPNDRSTLSQADSVVRAAWGAHRGWLIHGTLSISLRASRGPRFSGEPTR